jgi:hypothetical protein
VPKAGSKHNTVPQYAKLLVWMQARLMRAIAYNWLPSDFSPSAPQRTPKLPPTQELSANDEDNEHEEELQ